MTHPPPLPDDIRERVRTRLKARIDDRGIPIARLARRVGLSKGTVHRLLDPTDTRDVHLGTLCALCRELRMDVGDLLAPPPGATPNDDT